MLKKSHLLLLPALVALLAAWWFVLGPSFLGGPATYIIVAGESMEPTLHSGDLAVLRSQDGYAAGDIVAYRVPEGESGEGASIIHRIAGGTAEEGFVTQGDNKNGDDLWRPKPEHIAGKMWFSIPGGGNFLLRLRQPMTLGLLVGGLGMLTVLSGGWGKPPRRSDTSRSRPRAASLGGPPGTRLLLGLVLAGALTRAIGLPRKKDREARG